MLFVFLQCYVFQIGALQICLPVPFGFEYIYKLCMPVSVLHIIFNT